MTDSVRNETRASKHKQIGTENCLCTFIIVILATDGLKERKSVSLKIQDYKGLKERKSLSLHNYKSLRALGGKVCLFPEIRFKIGDV